MAKLEIIKAGLLTTIQDRGRPGLAYYAIPTSGVMDPAAAQIALLLLRMPADAPVLECTSIAPHIYFHEAATIALSGADFGWTLDEQPVPIHQVIRVAAGATLRGKVAKDGLRGYLAVAGKLQLRTVLGAYATYVPARLGGLAGKPLQSGDLLEWDSTDDSGAVVTIPILPGPEYDWLSDIGKSTLCHEQYTISPESNRMGLRLTGQLIDAKAYQLPASAPVLPGFIQLPPSGQPIIVLQDGQTTGGYPRVAYLRQAELGRLNQVKLGKNIQFHLINMSTAIP